MKTLSVVIPCYNEEKNILLIFEKFSLVAQKVPLEVVLVNNGSYDNSEAVIYTHLSKYSFAKTTKIEKNQGYGFGILHGLKYTTGDFIGWTHADLQTDPCDIIKAYELIKLSNFCTNIFVKGLRKNRSLVDNFFTIGMSLFETLYLKKVLWDINAQPTIFHKSFFTKWCNPPHDFSLDLYAIYLARKYNLNIQRFNVQFPERMHGQSSWNNGLSAKVKLIKRIINFSIHLKKELNNDFRCP